MVYCNNRIKICLGSIKDFVFFYIIVVQIYERRRIYNYYGQELGKVLEVWLGYLGDEGVELIMFIEEEGSRWVVFWFSFFSGLYRLFQFYEEDSKRFQSFLQWVLVFIREVWVFQGDFFEIDKVSREIIDEVLISFQVFIVLDWIYNFGEGDLLESEKLI